MRGRDAVLLVGGVVVTVFGVVFCVTVVVDKVTSRAAKRAAKRKEQKLLTKENSHEANS